MPPLKIIGALLIVAGAIGFVGWILSNLIGALRMERQRQAPERRSPLWLVATVAVVAFFVLAAATDMNTARRLAIGFSFEADATFRAGSAAKLFTRNGLEAGAGRTYDLSSDRQRILLANVGAELTGAPVRIIVVQNWTEELKRLVPVD